MTYSSLHDLQSPGARRITPAMILAEMQCEALPRSGASMTQILSALHTEPRALGLQPRQSDLLGFLVSRTKPVDWEEDNLTVCAVRNQDICERFGVERSTVKRWLRGLSEGGWIIMRDSPNKQRWLRRDGRNGPVIEGYGFDLSPLSRRYDEMLQRVAAFREREREGKRLHRRVMILGRRITALCATALETTDEGAAVMEIRKEGHQLLALRGRDHDLDILSPLVEQMERLVERLEVMIAGSDPVDMDPMGRTDGPHNTYTNPDKITKVTVSGASCAGDGIEAEVVGSDSASRHSSSPLRGFKAGPNFLLQLVPELRDLCTSSRPQEAELVSAVELLTGSLGMSSHVWRQACSVMGRYEAAVAVCVISAKARKGKVRSAGGLLRAMIERHLDGTLALDRTLYGLASDLSSERTYH
ncbi:MULTISPECIES: plasmid replication protein RepC [Gluconobacter]|uniref:Uncharacterized protein n=2 Tax=Gluconobacter TaxID=441 RepID=A0A149S1R9_GLUOY|nr:MULTISPECIES: plasmid replication protein RepC [Gluconobacter]KXV20688.1 hypothetical protein AD934_02910 [Gluconobacter oxydans]KXV50608.1 hypothetical protein AD945_01570 [Gluconobacter albidus]